MEILYSDRGLNFTYTALQEVFKILGIEKQQMVLDSFATKEQPGRKGERCSDRSFKSLSLRNLGKLV